MPKKTSPKEAPPDELSFFLREAARHKLLTKEEEAELARKTKGEGEEAKRAREKFFQHNMRLVVSIARGYTKVDLETTDLVQEGSIGLVRAIEKFDPEKGFRFSTYASWWVRQAITRAIYNSSGIRLPANINTSKNFLRRLLSSNPDLSKEEILDKTGFSEKLLDQLRSLPTIEVSLDEPQSEDKESPLIENITDPDAPDYWDKVYLLEISEYVLKSLESANPRDKDIFLYWVGGENNFQEIANHYGVSRERVRQIVLKITKKVREKLLRIV